MEVLVVEHRLTVAAVTFRIGAICAQARCEDGVFQVIVDELVFLVVRVSRLVLV